MGGIKVIFILLFLWRVDFSSTQEGCICGKIEYQQHLINDTVDVIHQYTGFKTLKGVSSTTCNKIPNGYQFILVEKDNDTSFSTRLTNVKQLEESMKNSPAVQELCFKLVIECDCTHEQEIRYYVSDTNTYEPEFVDETGTKTTEYVYTFPMPSFPSASVENFGITIRAKDIDMSNMKIHFSTPNNDDIYFEDMGIDPEDNLAKTHIASLKLKNMIYFETKTYTIIAEDQDGRPTEAQLVINMNAEESIKTSKFEKPYYEGKCDLAGVCVTDIKLDSGAADVTIVDGENKEFFEFDSTTSTVILKGDITEIKAEFVILLLEAKPPLQLAPVNAIASIAIPKSTEEEPELTFKTHPESFSLHSTEVQKIHTFEATSTNRRDTITFAIKGDSPSGITLEETGVLRSTDTVPSGRHSLVIVAKGDVSGLEVETSIVLNVLNFDICDDDTVHAGQTFVVMNIKEGSPTQVLATHQELLDLGYKYRILNQYPDEDMFEASDDGSVMSKSLDREADYFSDFKLPQFTLMLELQKDDQMFHSNRTRTVRSTKDNDYSMVEGINMFKVLEYHQLRTAVVVVVDDDNDHVPEFAVADMTVCYPNKKIVDSVKPSYLMQVKATDKDSPDGEGFGKISYSTESSEVVIDESSGVIYPTEDIFEEDSTSFKVTATDGGGKKAELNVKVNLIDEKQIGELTLNNVPFEELDAELKKLSQTAGFDIGTFSIPVNPYEKTSRTRAGTYQLRIFIYALKNDAAIEVDEMKEKLESVDDVELKPFEPNTNDEHDDEHSDSGETTDTTGLIAAVSVLSVLLVLFIIGAGTLWYFKFRPKLLDMNNEFEEEASQVEQKIGRFEKNSAFIPPQPPLVRRLTVYPENPSIPEEDSLTTPLENKPPPAQKSKVSIDAAPSYDAVDLNEDDAKNRRKSVTFNSDVQKFQIEKNADDEDSDDAVADDVDDDTESKNESDEEDKERKLSIVDSKELSKLN